MGALICHLNVPVFHQEFKSKENLIYFVIITNTVKSRSSTIETFQ